MSINRLVLALATARMMPFQPLPRPLGSGISFKPFTLSSLNTRTVILVSSLSRMVVITDPSLPFILSNRMPPLMPERSKARRSTLLPLVSIMDGLTLVSYFSRYVKYLVFCHAKAMLIWTLRRPIPGLYRLRRQQHLPEAYHTKAVQHISIHLPGQVCAGFRQMSRSHRQRRRMWQRR